MEVNTTGSFTGIGSLNYNIFSNNIFSNYVNTIFGNDKNITKNVFDKYNSSDFTVIGRDIRNQRSLSLKVDNVIKTEFQNVKIKENLLFYIEEENDYIIYRNNEYNLFAYGDSKSDIIEQLEIKLEMLLEDLNDGTINYENIDEEELKKLKRLFYVKN